VCFLDWGKNALHLELIRQTLEAAGAEVIVEEVIPKTCIKKPNLEKMDRK